MKIRKLTLGMKTGKEALQNFGPSCDIVEIEVSGATYYYMIDCGMEPSPDDELPSRGPRDLKLLESIPQLDAFLLTHGHLDHAGAGCMSLVRKKMASDAPVIATVPTAAFFVYASFEAKTIATKRGVKIPYSTLDIHKMAKRLWRIERPRVIELVPGKIWVLVWPSGHIRGACSYIFRIREGAREIKVMVSGDYAIHDQLSTLGALLPPDEWYPDILQIECTNGAEDLTVGKGVSEADFWKYEVTRMADDAHMAVKQGGWFFTSAFAIDRCQTFARKLADLGLLTYLDGDGKSSLKIHALMESSQGSWCDGDRPVNLDGVTITDFTGEPLAGDPCAIVAPSGMGHGPAAFYLEALLSNEKAVIGASGYAATGTNIHRVINAERGSGVKLQVQRDKEETTVDVRVAARCEQYRATAHGLRGQMAERAEELLKRSCLRNSGTPILGFTHGSSRAFDWFEWRLRGIKTFRSDRESDRDIVLYEN